MNEKFNLTQTAQVHEVEYGILYTDNDNGKILNMLWFKLKDSDRFQTYKGIQTMSLNNEEYKRFEKIENPGILNLFITEHNNAIQNMINGDGFWAMRDDFREAAFNSFLTITASEDKLVKDEKVGK